MRPIAGTAFAVLLLLAAACVDTPEVSQVDGLVYCGWPEDALVRSVASDVETELGVRLINQPYDDQEAAAATLGNRHDCDILVMDYQHIPALVERGLLAEIDHSQVPNIRFLSPSFRGLAHDPDNRHSAPYTWGATGLVVRTDLFTRSVAGWADLWDTRYAGRVVAWSTMPDYMIGVALLSLGYPLNSGDPAQLTAALDRLVSLRPNAIWLSGEETAPPLLVSGQAVMAIGWAYDAELAREENPNIAYVFPQEGAILSGDSFVIPAISPNRLTAERVLDFLLRPAIAARIMENNRYPMPYDPALEMVNPALRSNTEIFPTNEQMRHAHILALAGPEGHQQRADLWKQFMAGMP